MQRMTDFTVQTRVFTQDAKSQQVFWKRRGHKCPFYNKSEMTGFIIKLTAGKSLFFWGDFGSIICDLIT